MSSNNPMHTQGVDVDIETGLPVSQQTAEKDFKDQQAIEQSQTLINELRQSVLIDTVVAEYTKRVNELISKDPECIAYEKVLTSISIKINMGQKILHDRSRKIQGVTRKDTYAY